MDTVTLYPCPTEDSTQCVWDAAYHGNGEGTSYFTYGTTAVYLAPTARVESVTVAKEGPFDSEGHAQYTVNYAVKTVETAGREHTAPPAYDLTLPVIVVATALVASVITVTVGFFRRDRGTAV